MRRTLLAVGCFVIGSIQAVQVNLVAAKDNTLFEDVTGSTSNGAGAALFAGVTAGGSKHRAVLAFDLSSIPASATINAATLSLNVNKAGFGGADTFSLYRLQQNWGEGTSSTTAGGGALATTGDATWLHSFYSTTTWATPGGDFDATATASASMGAVGSYAISSTQLATDLQTWLASPAANFGWLLKSSETIPGSSLRFESRESITASVRPTLTVDYSVVAPSSSNWVGDNDGSWGDATKWSAGVPDAAGAHAVLGPVISTARTVSLASARTVGTLTIDSAQPYTISGSGTLNFDASSSDVFLNVPQGSHSIQSALTTAAGKQLHKTGSGAVQLRSLAIDSLSVESGTVSLQASQPPSTLKTLTFSGGKLDLTNNTLRLDDGAASPINSVRSNLLSGALLSSATTPGYAVGYRSVGSTRVDVALALTGDVDFDGKVNTLDFNVLAANFGGSSKYWADGEFNYDAVIDSTDFNQFAANYGRSAVAAPILGSMVPEPTSAALVLGLSLLGKRSRVRQ